MQIIHVLKTIESYLRENPLCIIFEEVFEVRLRLLDKSSLKLSQKNCTVTLVARGGTYYFKTKIFIPADYPNSCVSWNEYESNLPLVLVRFLNGQAKELARQCVEAPLQASSNSTFEPRPSFERSIGFLIDATYDFQKELCPICKLTVLTAAASDVVTDDTRDEYVERVYCGHIYHQGCLKKYMREPPFPAGGKLCPAQKRHPRSDVKRKMNVAVGAERKSRNATVDITCGIRLSHDRWGLNIKLAEARWAQQQARVRELEEVIDFLQ